MIFFQGPHSFTGEDTVEFHCHGAPVVLEQVVEAIQALGVRDAEPGEFTKRAFLNGKIDLSQAESIADLIESGSKQVAKAAVKSLQGDFSDAVNRFDHDVLSVRTQVEALIDFSDEEITPFEASNMQASLKRLHEDLNQLLSKTQSGVVLSDKLKLVIVGRPNVGKSSLLNALLSRDTSIVTDIAGTTRDVVKENLLLNQVEFSVSDTAGLRETHDPIEQQGISRALKEVMLADIVLFVEDFSSIDKDTDEPKEKMLELFQKETIRNHLPDEFSHFFDPSDCIFVLNKIDLSKEEVVEGRLFNSEQDEDLVFLSVKERQGFERLTGKILSKANTFEFSGEYTARQRHVTCLKRAKAALSVALHLVDSQGHIEMVAEELRLCQSALGEIVGKVTVDDLLGNIFSSFCIGK